MPTPTETLQKTPATASAGIAAAGPTYRVPYPRRLLVQDRVIDGQPGAALYYGAEVVLFDEPHLFGLAHGLAEGQPFDLATARGWAPDAAADEVGDCLSALQRAGLIADVAEAGPAATPPLAVPEAPAANPLHWITDAARIGTNLLGQPIAEGHLELVVPMFRLIHPMLDTDDRQVGEANVFPRALRLQRPTDWTLCTYSGTRHRADKPMNTTALRAMRAHWPAMIATLAAVRAACLQRFGLGHDAQDLTLGQIERLCIAVLSLPTWAALRPGTRVPNGQLDPVLSSLFRVTDGLRLVVHQMMMISVAEPALPPTAVVPTHEILDYAERTLSFHSETGVCAGPRLMVEDFLAVLVDGRSSRLGGDAAPMVDQTEVAAALDYGFAALGIHAAAFTFWPVMADAWDDIRRLAETLPAGKSPELDAFRAEAARAGRILRQGTHLGTAALRDHRIAVYDDMHRESARTTGQTVSGLAAPLASARPDPALSRAVARGARLRLPGLSAAKADRLGRIVARFAARASAVIALADTQQTTLSRRLGRPPAPPFTARDMTLHLGLQDADFPRLPFLPDTVAALSGVTLEIPFRGEPVACAAPHSPGHDAPGIPRAACAPH